IAEPRECGGQRRASVGFPALLRRVATDTRTDLGRRTSRHGCAAAGLLVGHAADRQQVTRAEAAAARVGFIGEDWQQVAGAVDGIAAGFTDGGEVRPESGIEESRIQNDPTLPGWA